MSFEYHIGRSWVGTRLEDECPCPKAPCGLATNPVEGCDQHWWNAGKTIRQMHRARECPGPRS